MLFKSCCENKCKALKRPGLFGIKMTRSWRSVLRQIWRFLWHDNSVWSWIVNIILAFVIIKFLIYPGLGLLLGTGYPIVAVVSGSMDHHVSATGDICGKHPLNYETEDFWSVCSDWYKEIGITETDFAEFPFSNGFRKGDIIVLKGKSPKDINIGDVIVFTAKNPKIKTDPIIHRVVEIQKSNSNYVFKTKGDHNAGSWDDQVIGETEITENRILGTGWFKLPWLGYLKIGFVKIIGLLR
ncbi:signal peptidase I [Candidatus Woesearchaeota archaeon]|nr:signal peptidase I [Candidatus Woesearchaeota archaeon]